MHIALSSASKFRYTAWPAKLNVLYVFHIDLQSMVLQWAFDGHDCGVIFNGVALP